MEQEWKNAPKTLWQNFPASWAASWSSCYLRLHPYFPRIKIKSIATGKEICSNLSNPQEQEYARTLYYALKFLRNFKSVCSLQQVIYLTKISNPFKAEDISETVNQKTISIFFSPLCCCCKHASHSKDILTHVLHHHLDIWGGESNRTWNSAGEEAAVWEEQERRQGKLKQWLYACIFQSNKHIGFLIHHHPHFKFTGEHANCWEKPVRHGSTTWHTQHGSVQQCQAWLLADLQGPQPLGGMQRAAQVPHRPTEG